ncbi:MAG: UDP-N-acetylmuramate dehydrogenase [Patescibacteria group bacterium]
MAKINIRKKVPLAELTTFKVGGYAKFFTEVQSSKELAAASRFAKKNSLPFFILGGGSDILISDKGFGGLVVRFVGKSIDFIPEKGHVIVTASSGVIWDDLVKESVKKGFQGVECLSGIPGTVGAAPIQNIGAYGQELKDVFVELNAYDFKTGRFLKFNKARCKFDYRESIFKRPSHKGRFFITGITIKLYKEKSRTLTYESLTSYLKKKHISKPSLEQVRNAVLTIRGQKLDDPAVLGNAGSFFKNPIVTKTSLERIQKKYPEVPYYSAGAKKVKLFAGWLIENAGWKGRKHKNAKVSSRNALVITNPKGRATAKEVKELSDKISHDVYKKFKIKLEPEVQFIGFN